MAGPRDILALQADVVGQYELIRLLGHGGFCAVYEARDRNTGERVALKQLRRMGPASLSSFKREFRAVQGVHHPHLVELRELFEFGGACFIAMELVEGIDLISHVRSSTGRGFDEAKLRSAFGQLSEALMALHAAGVVHRDLKPRNVLVTARGRVVLLDFGLAKTLGDNDMPVDPGVGSAVYMAPEQVEGAVLGPAGDFYALGVCLYEALTGTTPFASRPPFELMQIKQGKPPPSPAATVADIPKELDALCTRLLEPRPDKRPSAADVERAFNVDKPSVRASSLVHAPFGEGFGGREGELEALRAGFARSCAGELALVLVDGESGIGKSALVAEFLRRLPLQRPDVLVLRSRCYENELIAYKAFDGAMEQLARELSGLDDGACAALLPSQAVLLPRLFGAFGMVRAVTEAKARAVPADPAAQRLAAFAALSVLLARLSRDRPLVISIDDLHWADAESFRLLRAIVEDPQRPAVLIVCTMRPKAERSEEVGAAISLLQNQSCTQTIGVEGLARPDALELAAGLLGARANPAMLDTLVSESRGHPLFIVELARYAETRALTAGHITLDDALRARIESLAPAAQQLLSAVAFAGRPYHAEVFASVAQLPLDELSALSTQLLASKLLRRRRGHELACFHDRIRQVAQGRLSHEQTRALHERLAAALALQPNADAAELASHYDAAGRTTEAVEAYGRAAQQALSALTFARAEQLFLRALTLATNTAITPKAMCALRVGRGHALARGGLSAEAAGEYLAAAQYVEGQDKTQLRIWAAQQLLQSARVEEGMRAARALLSELGVPLPATPAATVLRLLWDRTCVNLRGLQIGPSRASIPMQARMQLDALWGLAMPVAWLDPLTSAGLSTRHLRLARAYGESTHMARALAEAAFAHTIQHPDASEADRLLARARVLCDASHDPALEVIVSFREAAVATFRWDLPRAKERLEHAQLVGTENCPDQPWLLTNVRTNLASVRVNMGEHARFATSCNAWIGEARDRNDQFALSMLEGLGNGSFRHLMVDAPDLARASLAAVLSPWPHEPFSFAHFGELIGVTYTELYRGGASAQQWLAKELPRLSRAFVLKTGFGKGTLLMFRARTSLAAHNDANPQRAAQLVAEAHTHTRALKAIPLSSATINALSLEAQLLALRGEIDGAIDKAREVRRLAESRGYFLVLYPSVYLEGLLEGGAAGRQKQQEALAFFAEQGWLKPRRAVAMLCPVIDHLEGERR